jgi:hypothetical protein
MEIGRYLEGIALIVGPISPRVILFPITVYTGTI